MKFNTDAYDKLFPRAEPKEEEIPKEDRMVESVEEVVDEKPKVVNEMPEEVNDGTAGIVEHTAE